MSYKLKAFSLNETLVALVIVAALLGAISFSLVNINKLLEKKHKILNELEQLHFMHFIFKKELSKIPNWELKVTNEIAIVQNDSISYELALNTFKRIKNTNELVIELDSSYLESRSSSIITLVLVKNSIKYPYTFNTANE